MGTAGDIIMCKKLDGFDCKQNFSDFAPSTKFLKFYLPASRNVRSFSRNKEVGKFFNLEKSADFLPKNDALQY